MVPLWDFGVRLIAMLQSWGNWLLEPMKLVSFLGTEDFFMVVLPILYWCVDTTLGAQLAVILMVSNCLNGVFKAALHGPRPYWYSSLVQGLAQETSFGVPSNHVQTATVIWGVLAAWVRKGWAWAVAAVIVALMGLSRMYLGVHFPHDVALGFLIGALLLFLLLRYWKPLSAWARALPLPRQVLFSFLVSLVLIFLPLIPLLILTASGWQPPQAWASFASQALVLGDVFTGAGVLFGLLGGYAWILSRGGFETRGNWWQLALRFLLGVAGVLAIRYGLKAIFPEGENVLAYSLRYLRYALIGFWMTGAAPWIFIKLKLSTVRSAASVPHYDSLTERVAP